MSAVYVRNAEGLFAVVDGHAKRQDIDITGCELKNVYETGGRRLLSASSPGGDRLYEYEGRTGRWEVIARQRGIVDAAVGRDGALRLGVLTLGVARMSRPPASVPGDWSEPVMRDLGKRMREARESVPAVPGTDARGDVKDAQGRPLFTGLGRLLGAMKAAFAAGTRQPPDPFDAGPWDGLAAWLSRGLELDVPKEKTLEWAGRSRDILRADPKASLEQVLAEAFVKTFPALDAGRAREARRLLARGYVSIMPGVKAHRFEAWRGRLYAFTDQGLYLREDKGWRLLHEEVRHGFGFAAYGESLLVGDGETVYKLEGDRLAPFLPGREFRYFDIVRAPDGKAAYLTGVRSGATTRVLRFDEDKGWRPLEGFTRLSGMVELSGRTYAGTDNGLYLVEGEKWTRAFPRTGNVTDLTVHDGRLFFRLAPRYDEGDYATEAYELEAGREPRRILRGFKGAYFWTHGGRLYAKDDEGRLLELVGGRWQGRGRGAHESLFHAEIGADQYILRTDGFYLVRDGVWRPQNGDVRGYISWVREFAGRRYLTGRDGLYEETSPGEWRLLFPGSVWGFHPEADGVLFGMEEGTYRFVAQPAALPSDWRGAVIKDLEAAIRRAQADEAPAPGYAANAEGDIKSRDGRTLFSGLGRVLAAVRARDGFWEALERWPGRALGLELEPGRTRDWVSRAAALLREDPKLALERALAEAFAFVHERARDRKEAVADLYAAGDRHRVLDAATKSLFGSGDRLYALADGGLRVREAGRWRLLQAGIWRHSRVFRLGKAFLIHDPSQKRLFELRDGKLRVLFEDVTAFDRVWPVGRDRFLVSQGEGRRLRWLGRSGWRSLPALDHLQTIVEFEGRIVAGTPEGLFVLRNGRWVGQFPGKRLSVNDLVEHDGLLYGYDAHGRLFSWDGGGSVARQIEKTPVERLFKKGDRLYAAAREHGGLFELTATGWKELFGHYFALIEDLAERDIFISTREGNFRGRDGRWTRQVLSGRINASAFSERGRRRYAATDVGLYRIDGESWRREAPGDLRTVAAAEDGVYYGDDTGLYFKPDAAPAGVPRDWRRKALRYLRARIRRAQRAAGEAERSPVDANGDVRDPGGRALFSGLGRVLGAVRAGFASARPRKDSWQELEKWVGLELGLELPEGKTEAWARRVRDAMRKNPAASFDETLTEAFAKTYEGLDADKLREARLLLAHGYVSSIPGVQATKFKEFGGFLYAFTKNGLYLREGKSWRLINEEVADAYGVYEHQGSLLVGDGKAVSKLEGDKLEPVLPGIRHFWLVESPDGKTSYLSTWGNGVYRGGLKQGWQPLPGVKQLTSMTSLGGQVLAVTDAGLFRVDGESWTSLTPGFGHIYKPVAAGDRVFFSVDKSLDKGSYKMHWVEGYEMRAGEAPRRIFKEENDPHFWEHAGSIYADAGDQWLWEYSAGRWKRLFQRANVLPFQTTNGDDLYVSLPSGLHVKDGSRWLRQEGDVSGYLGAMVEFGGRRYLAAGDGLYGQLRDEWTPLVPGVSISALHVDESGVCFGTEEGTFRYVSPPAALAENWREALLKEVGASILRAQEEEGDAPSSAYAVSDDGDLKDEGGRTLFAGLARWLGAMKAGFAAGRTEGLGGPIWERLADWVARQLSVDLPRRGIAEWARRSRDGMRDDPAVSLEQALADALAKAWPGLGAERMREARRLLAHGYVTSLAGANTMRFKEFGGFLYAFTDRGVYVRKGRGWQLVDPNVAFGFGIQEHDGSLLVSNGESLCELQGEKLVEVLPGIKHFWILDSPDGKGSYLSTWGRGVYRGGLKTGWRSIPGISELDGIAELGGEVWAGTRNGLYRIEGENWIRMFPEIVEVHSLHVDGGRLFFRAIAKAEGNDPQVAAYELEAGGRPRRIFADRGSVDIWKHAGRLYAKDQMNWLWERRDGRWLRRLQLAKVSPYSAVDGDDLYVSLPGGIYAKEGRLWRRQKGPIAGFVTRAARLADRRYLVAGGAVFEKRAGTWARIVPEMSISGLHASEAGVYFGTREGTFKYAPPPENWREALMQDIVAAVARAQGGKSAPPVYVVADNGDVAGEDGGTLFNGLSRRPDQKGKMKGGQ
ncbi:MAG: hypothetical protein PHF00_07305 [Elusimicrobia bacterium]|nr:hypothetical protein [Elusimicrobiota bacterium]